MSLWPSCCCFSKGYICLFIHFVTFGFIGLNLSLSTDVVYFRVKFNQQLSLLMITNKCVGIWNEEPPWKCSWINTEQSCTIDYKWMKITFWLVTISKWQQLLSKLFCEMTRDGVSLVVVVDLLCIRQKYFICAPFSCRWFIIVFIYFCNFCLVHWWCFVNSQFTIVNSPEHV